jgi:hypothetical protein
MSNKIENLFTLTPKRKPTKSNPILFRRNKLLNGINKQIQNIHDMKKGLKVRNVWFFNDENNNFYLIVKYGKSEVELSKNKYSIMCKNIDEVLDNLTKLKDLVSSGHFDMTLTEMSKSIRQNFTIKSS